MKTIFLTLVCAASLLAQETVSRVIQLKNIHPDTTAAVLDIMAAGKVRWRTDGNLRIIALNGPAELVDAMDAAIKKLDVPVASPKSLELTFHIITANGQAGTAPVPQELAGVVKQLENVFGLKSFRLLESTVMRGREGRGMESNGLISIPVKGDGTPGYYLKCQRIAAYPGDKGLQIRIDNLEFRVDLPTPGTDGKGVNYRRAGIQTDVDLREGQKVVVGKSTIDTSGQTVFLIVSAKAVD